jgi:uracil-DNA glycosylase
LRSFGHKLSEFPFAHDAIHQLLSASGAHIALFDSYHCSRYNTNTGVLTIAMFRGVFTNVRARIDAEAA